MHTVAEQPSLQLIGLEPGPLASKHQPADTLQGYVRKSAGGLRQNSA